jgi:Flp pilus assembly protein TadB
MYGLTKVASEGYRREGVAIFELLLGLFCMFLGVIVMVIPPDRVLVVSLVLMIVGMLLLADYLRSRR